MEPTKKAKTMELKGNEYAKVAERLRLFREENPRASIKTEPTMMPDGQVMYKAYILKDKSDLNSADATAHAMGNTKDAKAFEKLETVAVGRALALMGFLASGDIASSEEMEEFEREKERRALESAARNIESLEACQSLDELKTVFMSCDMSNPLVIAAKDAMKAKLAQPKEAVTNEPCTESTK